jgi:hypothetical protein
MPRGLIQTVVCWFFKETFGNRSLKQTYSYSCGGSRRPSLSPGLNPCDLFLPHTQRRTHHIWKKVLSSWKNSISACWHIYTFSKLRKKRFLVSVCMSIWTGCMTVCLAIIWRVGRILFIFGIQEFVQEFQRAYVNKAMKEWKQSARNGIQLVSGERIQTILYADY